MPEPALEATHLLSDVSVSAITLVKRGANRRRFALLKSDAPAAAEGSTRVTLPAPHALLKASDDWKTAYVVVAAPDWVEDGGQGREGIADRWASVQEIEKAAHSYFRNAGYVNIGEHGSPADPELRVVESFVSPADLKLGGEAITKGSWVVGIELNKAAREQVEAGEITGVSIEGLGLSTPIAKVAPTERSVMVALYPEASVANALAIDKGEHPADLHLTLAYLGDVSEDRLHLVVNAVYEAVDALDLDGLTGDVAGGGAFTNGEQTVHYASVDAPSLPALRDNVVRMLDSFGIPARADHGFTPHITLRMGGPATPPRIPAQPVRFDSVHVVQGDRTVAEIGLTPNTPVLIGKKGRLDRSPKKNWVEEAGGLPSYIEEIALALERKGKPLSQAIPIAINTVKRWAAGGDNVNADTRAKAAKALAQWEATKARSKGKSKMSKMLDTLKKALSGATLTDDEEKILDGIAKAAEGDGSGSGADAGTVEKTKSSGTDEENTVDEKTLALAFAKAMEPTNTLLKEQGERLEKLEKAQSAAQAPEVTVESLAKEVDDLAGGLVSRLDQIGKSLETLGAGGTQQAAAVQKSAPRDGSGKDAWQGAGTIFGD